MALPSQGATEKVVVCGVGTVVSDDRRAVPYRISGCMVGEPVEQGGKSYLRGFTFVTRIDREDARWPRAEAPDPCPHCGHTEASDGAS